MLFFSLCLPLQAVAEMIEACLSVEPTKRPTAAAVLQVLRDAEADEG